MQSRFFIDPKNKRVTLRAIEAIDAGEEVVASYGTASRRRPTHARGKVNEAQCARFHPCLESTAVEDQRLKMAADIARGGAPRQFVPPESGSSEPTPAVRVRAECGRQPAAMRRRLMARPPPIPPPALDDDWTEAEKEQLGVLLKQFGAEDWEQVAAAMRNSASKQWQQQQKKKKKKSRQRSAAGAAYIWHAHMKHDVRWAKLKLLPTPESPAPFSPAVYVLHPVPVHTVPKYHCALRLDGWHYPSLCTGKQAMSIC